MQPYAIGIDLGGTKIKGALVGRVDGLVMEADAPTEADHGPAHVIDQVVKVIKGLVASDTSVQVRGIGVGVPGTIGDDRAVVPYLSNLPGWTNINLRQEINDRTDFENLPVIVENDANVAGLGSAHYGAGRPFDSFIMITLGTGVGGAIIHNNGIFRGMTGGAGEIGHVTIDFAGPFDRSGIAGALEAYIGQRFLSHHARHSMLPKTDSLIHETAGDDLEGLTPKLLYEAALQGDKASRDMLAWAGHKLGVALGSCVNLLDIRKFVVGGGVSAAGDFVLEPVRQTITDYVIPSLRDGIEVIRETRGNEVGMLGAAHLIFQHLDAHAPSGSGS
ncbi:MAG: ROK family protein [Rhodothermales bacterium]